MSSESVRKAFEKEERNKEENMILDSYLHYRNNQTDILLSAFAKNEKDIALNTKENSEEFSSIMGALREITTLEHGFRRKKKDSMEIEEVLPFDGLTVQQMDPEAQIKSIRDMLRRQHILLSRAQNYLKTRNPHSTSGEARYKLVLRAEKLAKDQIRGLLSRLNSLQAEASEQEKYEDSMKRRRFAVRDNKYLTETERNAELSICDSLDTLQEYNRTEKSEDERYRATADFMSRIMARNQMTVGSKSEPKASYLKKLSDGFMKNGLAKRMLNFIRRKGFHKVADTETSELYKTITKAAKEAKHDKENVNSRNKAAEDYMKRLKTPETWGMTQKELDEFGKLSKELEGFSTERTAVMTLAIGLMLSSKDPVYTVEQICNLDHLQGVREEYGQKALKMLKDNKYEEIRNALYTVETKGTEQVLSAVRKLPEINPETLKENHVSAFVLFLQDANQEFTRLNRKLVGWNKPMKDHTEAELRKWDNQCSKTALMLNEIQNSVQFFEGELSEFDMQKKVGKYLNGKIMTEFVREAKDHMFDNGLLKQEFTDTMDNLSRQLTPVVTAMITGGDNPLSIYCSPESGHQQGIQKLVLNDSLADVMKLKIDIKNIGEMNVDLDQNALMTKLGIKINRPGKAL